MSLKLVALASLALLGRSATVQDTSLILVQNCETPTVNETCQTNYCCASTVLSYTATGQLLTTANNSCIPAELDGVQFTGYLTS